MTPLIGLTSDRRVLDLHPFHLVGEKYIDAVRGGADALPLLIPVLADRLPVAPLLAAVDGLVFTGSPSNILPKHYGGGEPYQGSPRDEERDATTLVLIKRAIEAGVPVLGLCRGLQELNVAYGGTLHQKVHEAPGFHDHRDDPEQDIEQRYGPAHDVDLVAGGVLAGIARQRRVRVNSLHGQGIDRLAPGLIVEARAPDGLIEAVRVEAARSFALAVQWHPEWRWQRYPFHRALWQAFGDVCRAYAGARRAA